jgi:hypothetical protein
MTHGQPRRKLLNRFGARAVYTAVLVIERCPSQPWIALVSCPFFRERVAAGMAEHERMRLEVETCRSGAPLDHPGKSWPS